MEKYLKIAVFRRYLVPFWRILDAFMAGFAADWGRIGVRGFLGLKCQTWGTPWTGSRGSWTPTLRKELEGWGT